MPEQFVTRGFIGKRQSAGGAENRVPPGQHLVSDFPVLSAGPTPHTKLEDWSFTLKAGGKLLKEWSWAEFEALPQTKIKTDIHCVTTWSKLDTNWQGVTIDDLMAAAGLSEPTASY